MQLWINPQGLTPALIILYRGSKSTCISCKLNCVIAPKHTYNLSLRHTSLNDPGSQHEGSQAFSMAMYNISNLFTFGLSAPQVNHKTIVAKSPLKLDHLELNVASTECDVSVSLSSISVTNNGQTLVAIQACLNAQDEYINIYASINKETLVKLLLELQCFEIDYVYADGVRYGLGGKLAVYATAFRWLRLNNSPSTLAIDGSLSHVLEAPVPLDMVKTDKVDAIALESLPENIYKYINGGEYVGRIPINKHKLPSNLVKSVGFIFASRNQQDLFQKAGQHKVDISKSAYSIISPSEKVLRVQKDLELAIGISPSLYEDSIGIHVRHGNGEKYYNKANGAWGVKPPTKREVFRSIHQCIDYSKKSILY